MAKLIINISFLKIVNIEDATSQSFKNYEATVAELECFVFFDTAERNSFGYILFMNHWMDRGRLNLKDIRNINQWITEERPKAFAEFGSEVWTAGKNNPGKMSEEDWDRVGNYVVSIDLYTSLRALIEHQQSEFFNACGG